MATALGNLESSGNNMSDIFLTSKELFHLYAPSFNFEKDEQDILRTALDCGFLVAVNNPAGGLLYMVNSDFDNGED